MVTGRDPELGAREDDAPNVRRVCVPRVQEAARAHRQAYSCCKPDLCVCRREVQRRPRQLGEAKVPRHATSRAVVSITLARVVRRNAARSLQMRTTSPR